MINFTAPPAENHRRYGCVHIPAILRCNTCGTVSHINAAHSIRHGWRECCNKPMCAYVPDFIYDE